jgi:SAM-dependent methyltransferase
VIIIFSADAAQAQPPDFDPAHNAMRTGRHFNDFFSQVTRGDIQKSPVPYTEAMDVGHARPFADEMARHTGHFDDHIAKSIPTYRENQARKGHAIATTIGRQPSSMLDIGGSEGSFAKAITAASGGNVRTTVLDPNPDMARFFQSSSQVPGATYDQRAFHKGWRHDDGGQVDALHSGNAAARYDVVHEAMTFQFVSDDRSAQVSEAKQMLAPGGLFLTEEKLKSDPGTWARNEAAKDEQHKRRYYSQETLQAKEKMVGFQAGKQGAGSVGMVDNMVAASEFEKTLLASFREVVQYWDSGNFKGYACSDDPKKVWTYVNSLGNMQSKFSTVALPRKVTAAGQEGADMKTTKPKPAPRPKAAAKDARDLVATEELGKKKAKIVPFHEDHYNYHM